MLVKQLEGEVALCLNSESDEAGLQSLLELLVTGPVKTINDLNRAIWAYPDSNNQILIVDFEQLQRQGCLQQLTRQNCQQSKKIAVLNTPADDAAGLLLLRAGIAGIFPPHIPSEILLKGLMKILEGELWFPRGVISRFVVEHQQQLQAGSDQAGSGKERNIVSLPDPEQFSLSRREWDVLELLCQGASNDKISERLFISIHTVKSHVSQILRKTHTRSRLDVVHWAMTQGLMLQQGLKKAG